MLTDWSVELVDSFPLTRFAHVYGPASAPERCGWRRMWTYGVDKRDGAVMVAHNGVIVAELVAVSA